MSGTTSHSMPNCVRLLGRLFRLVSCEMINSSFVLLLPFLRWVSLRSLITLLSPPAHSAPSLTDTHTLNKYLAAALRLASGPLPHKHIRAHTQKMWSGKGLVSSSRIPRQILISVVFTISLHSPQSLLDYSPVSLSSIHIQTFREYNFRSDWLKCARPLS